MFGAPAVVMHILSALIGADSRNLQSLLLFTEACLQEYSRLQSQEIGRGEPCQGNISETLTCNEQMCPVDCVMTEWTDAWPQESSARCKVPKS